MREMVQQMKMIGSGEDGTYTSVSFAVRIAAPRIQMEMFGHFDWRLWGVLEIWRFGGKVDDWEV